MAHEPSLNYAESTIVESVLGHFGERVQGQICADIGLEVKFHQSYMQDPDRAKLVVLLAHQGGKYHRLVNRLKGVIAVLGSQLVQVNSSFHIEQLEPAAEDDAAHPHDPNDGLQVGSDAQLPPNPPVPTEPIIIEVSDPNSEPGQ